MSRYLGIIHCRRWVDFFAGFIVVRLVCVSSLFGIIGRVDFFTISSSLGGISALFLVGQAGVFALFIDRGVDVYALFNI
jgi:hypothetical protein